MSVLAKVRTRLRQLLMRWHILYLRKLWGMKIGHSCCISFSAKLDKTYPEGIHIGDETAVNFGAVILAHEAVNNRTSDTRIGNRCQIGCRSVIMPGIIIGDNCIVAPASVVMGNIPSGSVVAGNPARIIEAGIKTGPDGRRIESWEAIVRAKAASSKKSGQQAADLARGDK
jgi:acetyltransferase-like isoleucine patch superfamily enzyme